jgi:hypothetical protein
LNKTGQLESFTHLEHNNTHRPDTRADLQNPNEEPVPLVETDADGREGQDAQEAGME